MERENIFIIQIHIAPTYMIGVGWEKKLVMRSHCKKGSFVKLTQRPTPIIIYSD